MKLRGIKTNLLFNVLGSILSLLVTLVTLPLYISYIGEARYGLLVIVWRLLGYFGFLDLGLSRASANALAKLGDPSMRAAREKVLVTALWLNLTFGTLGGLLFYLTGIFFINHLLSVPPDLKPEIEASFPWIACSLPFALVSGIGTGALESRERFLIANMLTVGSSVFGLVLPVICAVLISPSLAAVIPAAVIARGLSVLFSLIFALREERPLNPRSFDRQRCKSLLSYGGWISVSGIIGPLLGSVDQLMIGAVLGLAAVTHYSIPMSLVVRSQILAWALSRTLFPRLSRVTREEANDLVDKAIVTLGYAYGGICAAAMVFITPFFVFWMGKEFAFVSSPIAELLLTGAWINGFAITLFALLQGQGRPDIVAKLHTIEILPYVAVLWLLMNFFGLMGAAAAWTFMVTAEAVVLFLLARGRPAPLLQLIPVLLIILASYLYANLWTATPARALLEGILLSFATGVCALLFDPSTRAFVFSLRLPEPLRLAGLTGLIYTRSKKPTARNP